MLISADTGCSGGLPAKILDARPDVDHDSTH